MMSQARTLTVEHFRWIDGHADVWRIFGDSGALAAVVRGLAEPFRDLGVTAVCGMVEECGGHWAGVAVIVDQTVPARRVDLGVCSIVTSVELPAWDGQS
ncbi:hypothetical protein [Streptomyces sp. NPDC001930]|uniref:hypothetical protein n=1 Tax=Streptomyces sp. NPDC001930 TaxID=3364625 RepID=UPI0036CDAFF1